MKKITNMLVTVLTVMLLLCGMMASAETEWKDGSYEVEVNLTGGSGKASVDSPMKLTVVDGTITATIVWSSPNYDLMVVNEEYYYPVNEDGNSTFEIPLENLEDLAIEAETIAMSTPHMISYVLEINEDSLTALDIAADNSTFHSMTVVIVVLLVVVCVAVIAFLFSLNKRRKKGEQ